MAGNTVRVQGLRELQRDLKRIGEKDLQKGIDTELRKVGMIVAEDARGRFGRYDVRSAAGFRPRTRGFGRVVVEQRRRKTTGQHPEFGSLQMRRALLPALASTDVVRHLDEMLDRLGRNNGF